MTVDPLHIHPEAQDAQTDYQWLDLEIRQNPGATGWQRVTRAEMPNQPSEDALFIRVRGLTLYKRPMAVTEQVRAGERAVAMGMRDDPMRGAQVAKPLSSPRGPLPAKRTARDLWLFARAWTRRRFGWSDSQRIVEKWLDLTPLTLRRWADHSSVTVEQYVRLHTQALLDGEGRWRGQIIRSVPR